MIVTTRQATKSTMMAMAQWDMITMMMVVDIGVDDDNNEDTASCKAAVHREADTTQKPAGKNKEGGGKDGHMRRLHNKR